MMSACEAIPHAGSVIPAFRTARRWTRPVGLAQALVHAAELIHPGRATRATYRAEMGAVPPFHRRVGRGASNRWLNVLLASAGAARRQIAR